MDNAAIERAKEHFGQIVEEQLKRVEEMKKPVEWVDYAQTRPIIIGILGGDGIGPFIAEEARKIMEFLLKDDIAGGKIELRDIEGLTIENRVAHMQSIPDDVLAEIKQCHVTLKGPTTTPRTGDPWPNIESCNVAMRRYLDLFANFRPVRVPKLGIDWTFFRENTEGAYIMGSRGIQVTENLAVDFKVTTKQGSERIIRLAFEYAKKHNISKVTIVTKANVVKTSDGLFLDTGYRIAKEYPEIECDDWYIDIMTAKLVDEKRRRQFKVIVLPNLYGDILTDEAAEFQGGVGTAGSANLGKRYSMFEAIHGSAPRMVKEGRAKYADPGSMIKAASLLINHLGYADEHKKLEMAIDICANFERKYVMTGRDTGDTGADYAQYLMDTIVDPKLEERWNAYQEEAMKA
jgi:isocitrate dehydrogenase (NAD+)